MKRRRSGRPRSDGGWSRVRSPSEFKTSGVLASLFKHDKTDRSLRIPWRLRYDVAVLYLQQSDYDLDLAVETYLADEKWDKEHPMEGASGGGKTRQKTGKRRIGVRTGRSGQF